MKRNILASLLLAVLFLTAIPATTALAADVNDYTVMFTNFNQDVAENNPTNYRRITLKADQDPVLVQAITTYHWNNGLGATPGSISIWEGDQQLGSWQATGRNYYGMENIYWDVFPNYLMQPGHSYIIKDSGHSTWSQNETSENCGMFELRGAFQPKSDSAPPKENNFDNGYRCSDWALDEVKQADFIGIFPDSLRNVDLTQPITRAEFAAVSVNMYCRKANTTVEPYSPNPFTDTNDRDVLRAYAVGITAGTGGTSFSPNINLTREQGATMLTRAYKRMIYPEWTLATDSQFPLSYSRPAFFEDDADISDYAYQSVNFMFANSIINGIGNNKFGPKNSMTREQALAIAVRMIDNLEGIS